jgi:HSP20 family protein
MRYSVRPVDFFARDIFDNLFEDAIANNKTAAYRPVTKAKELEDHLLLTVDLPGVKQEDVNLEIKGDNLSLKAKRDELEIFENFTVDKNYQLEKLEAHLENGVLSLAIPKVEELKPRRIEIHSSKTRPSIFSRLLGDKKEAVEIKN